MHDLRAKIDMLKNKITEEIDKSNGCLQEEKILNLSKELDELINEFIEVCK